MKKKILLALTLAFVLSLILVVSVNAEVTIYDDFDVNDLENIEYRTNDVIVFDDGFSCPSVYVFKDTKTVNKGDWGQSNGLKNVLDFTYINSKIAPDKEYGFDDIDSIDIPQGVTSIGMWACNGMTTIRIISIPDTVTTIDSGAFQNASGLEYCIMEHSGTSALTTLSGSLFSGSGLKAFSMPDCITTLSSGYVFQNCKSMKAVYLSKNLTAITASGECFDWCGNMYLVNEPFVAKSENEIPEKPSVYYFPSKLTTLGPSCTFRGTSSINDVLVFPKNYTATTNAVAFQNCPANTVVFLGDMTNVDSSGRYPWGTKNFIFANPNDKSASDLTLALASGKNAYFCYGEGTVNHIKEQSKTTAATCTLPAMVADYCFCGQIISGTETTDGDALGHNHTIFVDLVYTSFAEDGYYSYECDRCGDVNNETIANALFKCVGYSAPEFGEGGIAIGFVVNHDAIDQYEKVTNSTVEYGVFAIVKDRLGENDIFDENGNITKGAISANISSYDFDIFELRIVGFAEEQKDIKIAMGGYVAVTDVNGTKYSYMQAGTPNENEKYCFVSYNDIVGIPSTNKDTAQ